MKSIILGAGCFWCTEAVFKNIDGITHVTSGYMGGHTKNPTYEEVCEGSTNHAEVIKVDFDENIITLEKLLDIFFKIHDPTTLNKQGNDIGTQYRSIIFYKDDIQKDIATNALEKAKNFYTKEIVTKIEKIKEFYKAEEYHQDYFTKNPSNPYCNFAIPPKLEKLKN